MNSPRVTIAALVLALVVSSSSLVAYAQEPRASSEEVLTNEKVITMAKAGLGTSLIISKIRSSKTNFNVSTDELIRLKQARVPDDIISVMVEASGSICTKFMDQG
jgi:hypothetical protein